MKILCVHGIGNHQDDTSWQGAWKAALTEALEGVGAATPQVEFVMHDAIFANYPLSATTWAKAAVLLAESGIENTVTEGWRTTRGWLDWVGNKARWTAGMVVQWAADSRLREELRNAVIASAAKFRPDVLLGHSLGSLVCYDLLVNPGMPESLRNVSLLSLGSQIGNPAVRNTFGGRIVMPHVTNWWFHLFNPSDHVLTAPIKLFDNADRFSQLVTQFDVPNDVLNHEATYYIKHAQAREAWQVFSGRSSSTRRVIVDPAGDRPQHTHKALVVGIDRYADANNNLQGCVNDAYLVSEVLQETGFPTENIRLLVNERAKADAIRDRLEWLVADMQPGDVRYFHFSGHGAQLPAYGEDEIVDHLDECLVPHDFDFSAERAIVDNWFYKIYSQLPYDSYFMATLDCCHSGGMTRSGQRVRGLDLPDDILHRILSWNPSINRWADRDLAPENRALVGRAQFAGTDAAVRRLGRAVQLRGLPDAQYDRVRSQLGHKGPYLPILFEACQEAELAEEYRDGNKSYGAFTYALMTTLRNCRSKGENTSFSNLIGRTRELMVQLGTRQRPDVVGPQTLLDSTVPISLAPFDKLMAPPTAPAPWIARNPKVAQALDTMRPDLTKFPGVVGVRLGYRFRKDWITGERAVVVTVRQKLPPDKLARGSALPKFVTVTIDGKQVRWPVDVAPASPFEQLRADGYDTSDLSDSVSLFERTLLGLPTRGLGLDRKASESYSEPDSEALRKHLRAPVSAKMNILCHASPSTSFSVLKDFLAETESRLVMGMYDLTAPHVVEALIDSLEKPRKFTLVLDPKVALSNGGGGDNPKAGDKEETVVRTDLETALGNRFHFAWAAVKLQGKTTGGLFNSAYHIKVAVRDGSAFWLSSGNLQSTNQPAEDLPLKPTATQLRKFNREWHVIVQNKSLAEVFEKYLLFDFQEAERFQADTGERAFAPHFELLVPREVAPPKVLKTFRPKSFSKKVTVHSLLTPDNYADEVLRLITSAEEKLYFQNQYIHLGAEENRPKKFAALADALKAKVDEGLEVRIILRDLGDTRAMLEELQDFGIPGTIVKLQTACHNKGILVDSKRVLVGSHNWSGDGTTANRDASLIIDDADITAYYEQIFLYDWENRARQFSSGERFMPAVVPDGVRDIREITTQFPANVQLQRIAWDDYFED